MFLQGEGALTYVGRRSSPTVYGHHHTGKESLDINLSKAERHSAVPLVDHGLLQCDNDAAVEWVTYKYRDQNNKIPKLIQNVNQSKKLNGVVSHFP